MMSFGPLWVKLLEHRAPLGQRETYLESRLGPAHRVGMSLGNGEPLEQGSDKHSGKPGGTRDEGRGRSHRQVKQAEGIAASSSRQGATES